MSDRSENKRQRLRAQHGDNCWICGEAMDFANPRAARGATLDHMIPRSRGGPNHISNMRLAHKVCNERRGSPRASQRAKEEARA